jgi:Holliday junction resolvase
MRRAAKVDDNQLEIVKALRDMGCSVESLAAVGKGVPDLLIGYRSSNYLIEVKDGAKVPSKQKLTDDQIEWHESWRGQKIVINSIDAAIEFIKSL